MSVTASQIISRLEKIFAFHGLPVTITSENGPQFRSEEFERYHVDNGILHRKATPQWAQANGEVERQNRSLLKSMRIAQAEGKNCSLPCKIQNNSSHCHGSLPCGVTVWSEDSHKDA